jgi:competence ComEA-like helix-hairpin-helix protein
MAGSPPNQERYAPPVVCAAVMLVLAMALWQYARLPYDVRRSSNPHTTGFVIDLNQADASTLQLLPGIGPTLAQRIVEDREVAGLYSDVEDLRRVRGVGPLTIRRISPLIIAGTAPSASEPPHAQ